MDRTVTKRKVNRQAVLWAYGVVITVLLIGDAAWFFSITPPSSLSWVRFGFFAFAALLFMLIGGFVWFHAAMRQLACVLLVFCLAMSVTMVVQTGAASGSPIFTAISTLSSAAAMSSLLLFFLLFPHNYLASAEPWRRVLRTFVVGTLLIGNGFFLLIGICWLLGKWASHFAVWEYSDDILILSAVLVVLITSSLRAATVRAKQHLRLCVCAILLAIFPFVMLTLLPEALAFPVRYRVDSQISTSGLVLIPVALGYCVLRYQILVREAQMRRFVSRGVAIVCLGLFAYGAVVVSSRFPAVVSSVLLPLSCGFGLLIVLGWRAIQGLTDRLLFPEIWYVRRLVLNIGQQAPSSVDHVCLLLASAATMVESDTTASLFVLDEQTGAFVLSPQHPAPPAALAGALATLVAVESTSGQLVWRAEVKQKLEETANPVFASDLGDHSRTANGIGRYLLVPNWQDNPLLVPLRVDAALIGVLILTKRTGEQTSGTPHGEALLLLAEHFAPQLQQAREQRASSRVAALLTTFYSVSNLLDPAAFSSVQQAAKQWSAIAADVIGDRVQVAIWLAGETNEDDADLIQAGGGPLLALSQCQQLILRSNGQECYVEHSAAPWFADELAAAVVLSLRRCNDPPLGYLLLVFDRQRPHHFLNEEKHLLQLFAAQCAAGLDAVRVLTTLQRLDTLCQQRSQAYRQVQLASTHSLQLAERQTQGYLMLLRAEQVAEEMHLRWQRRAEQARALALLHLQILQILGMDLGNDDGVLASECAAVPVAQTLQEAIDLNLIATQFDGREIQLESPPELTTYAPRERLQIILWVLVHYLLSISPASRPVWVHAGADVGQVWIKGESSEQPVDWVATKADASADAPASPALLALCQRLVASLGAQLRLRETRQQPVFLLRLPLIGAQGPAHEVRNGREKTRRETGGVATDAKNGPF